MSLTPSKFRLRALAFTLAAALCLPAFAAPAGAQTKESGYEQKRRETNDIAVAIVVSGLSCTCARFAEDMRNVVNDLRPDGLRVLPVLGVGGLQNLKDVLFLKGVDMGIVDQDNLRLLKQRDPKLYANIEQRVHYITKLYNAELHVVAKKDIKSLADLKGKRVNFNVKEHQTEVTGDHLFSVLHINAEKTNYDVDESIKRLLSGDIAAVMIVTGAPQAALAKLKKEDGLHFVPVDQESLPGYDLGPVLAEYLPAEFTSKTYPNLIDEGQPVQTIANRALLVAYAWPEGSARYQRVSKFVTEFFNKIDQFHSSARHPKWNEINLWADIPGWTRFKPANDWLSAHQKLARAGIDLGQEPKDVEQAFNKFVAQYQAASPGRPLSQSDREALLNQIKQYMDRRQTER
jgi:TRAP transporter TAXI family solute receptor